MKHFLNKLKSGKSGENHKVLSDRRCRTSIGRWFTRSPRPLLCVAHTTNSVGCDVTTLVKQRLPVHNSTCSQACSKDRQPEVKQAVNDGHLRSWGYRSEEKKKQFNNRSQFNILRAVNMCCGPLSMNQFDQSAFQREKECLQGTQRAIWSESKPSKMLSSRSLWRAPGTW